MLKDTYPELQNMIRELSRRRFTDISNRSELELSDSLSPDDFIYGAHLTVIQLAAKDLRLTFKTHFNLSDVKVLTQRQSSGERSSEQIMKSSYDLFKEYSNLVAGGIAQQLHDSGTVAGISLPIATSGFNEIISSDLPRPQSYNDYWDIKGQDFSFSCSIFIEIFGTEALDQLVYNDKNLDALGGEIEIL